MADVIFLLIVAAFFGLCALYIRGCERIIRGADEAADVVGEVRQ